ncbi:MAG: alpha/beta hydrolase [Bacilli bacterium]|nr:alpha/beta hydrolase [Bacilli bacterium]
MQKQDVDLGGRKMAYLEKGVGQAVVLLHGFCGSSSYWDSVLPLLPDSHRFIIPDLRGHGDSDAPAGTYSMEVMAKDIAELLQQLRIEKTILLGHSLGGYITLAFAELYPERLNGFGLIHSAAFPDDDKGKQGRLNSMKTIRDNGLNVFIDGLIPKLFAPQHVETMPAAVLTAKEIGYATDPGGAVSTLEGMRTRPARNEVIQNANVQVLIVAGENDQIIPRERVFYDKGDHITQHLIAEAGHMSMMEDPQRLAEIMLAFIGGENR